MANFTLQEARDELASIIEDSSAEGITRLLGEDDSRDGAVALAGLVGNVMVMVNRLARVVDDLVAEQEASAE